LVEFRILGPLEVLERDRPLVVGGPKVRALLAVLLLHRGEVVSTDRLIDALWAERASATAAKTVHVYVSNLRKALGDGLLVTRGHGYLLQTGAGQVDLDRFEALVGEGRGALQAGDGRAAGERLREALALWRGPALADFAYEPFAQNAIARLEAARLAALEDRIDADLAIGEQAGLVGELETLVAEHPLRDRLRRQLMLALYRSGRQAEALESYREARQSLVDELGLEPGRDLQELERAILAQDPALEPPTHGSAPRPVTVARGARRGAWLIAAAGVVLLAAIAGVVIKLSGSSAGSVQVPANSVAVIDPHSNTVAGSAPVGSRPGAIAFGSGSLWVANLDDQTVSRVDPTSLRTIRTLAVGYPPTGIAASAEAVWVVGSNPNASSVSVNRIDPQFDAVGPSKRLPNIVPGGPAAVATQGATVWVAPSSGLLTRLDPATGRIHSLDPNSGPAAIAVGAGAIWLSDDEGDNVTRVDPTGQLTPIPVGNTPTGIAAGEGGVWVADSLDNAVVRIDPATRSVTNTIGVGRSPAGVAIGAGSVWVTNSADGTVTRIDPRTKKVQATITVGGSPQAIMIANGRAWVTVDAQTTGLPGRSTSNQALRMDSPIDVDSMDPDRAYYPLAWELLYATCAKLLNYPDKSGPAGARLIPEVAQSLPTRSPDGKTYTFTIRPGFRFSPPLDEPVTARTFKDTIERALNPRMKAPLAYEFADIAGARSYMAGKASHISGVVARGDTLTIHLVAPVPDFLSRIAEPTLCAVPSNTPVDPQRVIPSAGPYYVSSYTPGQGIVLLRNPNYRGSRPHQLARIEMAAGISSQRGVANIDAGTADYTFLFGSLPSVTIRTLASHLAARYGPGSPAASAGRQQYFVDTQGLDFLDLNTHRPLFANVRLRRSVNYAIDRRALAQLGDGSDPLPELPTDQYLPPGMPGYSNAHTYRLTPDLAKARALTQDKPRTAVLYTCNYPTCDQQAQIIKNDLAPIGIHVNVKNFQWFAVIDRVGRPGEPFDLATFGWIPDYPDPSAMLNPLLDDSSTTPTLDDPTYQRRLAAVERLTGPNRYLTYGKLAVDLARNAAPLVAYGNPSSSDFFSRRIGCQVYGIYGLDLAALCTRHAAR
jgi:YVTN family beta-propeller protein